MNDMLQLKRGALVAVRRMYCHSFSSSQGQHATDAPRVREEALETVSDGLTWCALRAPPIQEGGARTNPQTTGSNRQIEEIPHEDA